MRLIIFPRKGSGVKTRTFTGVPGYPSPLTYRVDLVTASGPIKYGLLHSLSHIRLGESAWQDLALIVEFEYRGVDTLTGDHFYRVRVAREGYSLPNGTGGEYWEPKIRDASEAYRWLRDEQITIRPDYPYADVFWQVPVGQWTTGEVSGKLKWTWDAEH
eukprot:tig00000270_g23907.t1